MSCGHWSFTLIELRSCWLSTAFCNRASVYSTLQMVLFGKINKMRAAEIFTFLWKSSKSCSFLHWVLGSRDTWKLSFCLLRRLTISVIPKYSQPCFRSRWAVAVLLMLFVQADECSSVLVMNLISWCSRPNRPNLTAWVEQLGLFSNWQSGGHRGDRDLLELKGIWGCFICLDNPFGQFYDPENHIEKHRQQDGQLSVATAKVFV